MIAKQETGSVPRQDTLPQPKNPAPGEEILRVADADGFTVEFKPDNRQDLPSAGLVARRRRGWGPRFDPNLEDQDVRSEYRRICNDLDNEVVDLRDALVGDSLPDEAAGTIAQVNDLLERLYDCPFGSGESLKAVVVAIQSQTNNIRWDARHVRFLDAVTQYLKARYVISDQTVNEVDQMIAEQGLDVFRGTVSDA